MNETLDLAIELARGGDHASARQHLREALKAEPDSELAWLWMAEVAESTRERKVALRQVLRINPHSEAAHTALQSLAGRPARPAPLAVTTEPAAEQRPPEEVAAPSPPGAEARAEEEPPTVAKPVLEPVPALQRPAPTQLAPEPIPPPQPDAGAEAVPPLATEAQATLPVQQPTEPIATPLVVAPQPAVEEMWPGDVRPRWVVPVALILVALIIFCLLAAAVLLVPQLMGERTDFGRWATAAASAVAEYGAGQTEPSLVFPDSGTPLVPPLEGAPPAEAAAGMPQAADEMPLLPNLVLQGVKIELEAPMGCYERGMPLGTRVVVQNAGRGDAGPFVIEVNGARQELADGLAAGEATSLWYEGYGQAGQTTVGLDATFLIEESDEADNVIVQRVPLPTPPLPCTPRPQELVTPEAGAGSVANTRLLAPVRITSRSVYSHDPSSYLLLELDAEGNARLARDVPNEFEDWYVIDGVVYAGEAPVEGLAPFEPIPDPESTVGFSQPFDVFVPRGESDRYTPVFPLHAALWRGVTPDRAQKLGSEIVQDLVTDRYKVLVEPQDVPQSVWITDSQSEDLAAAIAAGNGSQNVIVWVEPESGAIVKAVWDVTFSHGQRAQYTLEVTPVDLLPFKLPAGE